MESFLLSDTPQHQLTCRRVKDCCALMHNTILKWQSLTSESFDVASKIVNTSTEGMHVEQSDSGELKHLSEVKMRLEAKLIEERENNYCRLQELLSEMVCYTFCIMNISACVVLWGSSSMGLEYLWLLFKFTILWNCNNILLW